MEHLYCLLKGTCFAEQPIIFLAFWSWEIAGSSSNESAALCRHPTDAAFCASGSLQSSPFVAKIANSLLSIRNGQEIGKNSPKDPTVERQHKSSSSCGVFAVKHPDVIQLSHLLHSSSEERSLLQELPSSPISCFSGMSKASNETQSLWLSLLPKCFWWYHAGRQQLRRGDDDKLSLEVPFIPHGGTGSKHRAGWSRGWKGWSCRGASLVHHQFRRGLSLQLHDFSSSLTL